MGTNSPILRAADGINHPEEDGGIWTHQKLGLFDIKDPLAAQFDNLRFLFPLFFLFLLFAIHCILLLVQFGLARRLCK